MTKKTMTVEFSESGAEFFEKLCDKTDLCKSEVIINSIILYGAIFDYHQNGDSFLVKSADGTITDFEVFEP